MVPFALLPRQTWEFIALAALLLATPRDAQETGDGSSVSTGAEDNDVVCTLASLVLSAHGRPIDLDPDFRPHVFHYSATLDFSMSSFSVNVRPDTGCEDEGVPQTPTVVDIGSSKTLTLYAKHPDTGAKQSYDIEVSRLLGSETELQDLTVTGGELSPIFDPAVRSYSVRLDLAYDAAEVVYRLADNEQRIRCSAQEERPSQGELTEPKSTSDTSGSNASSTTLVPPSRRLQKLPQRGTHTAPTLRRLVADIVTQESGEIQIRDASTSFLLDVGFQRTIELTVQCADATQASIGTYSLAVTRPSCPDASPFFEPRMRRCVNFCPSGYYRNTDAKRCSQCNTNCQVCSGLLKCEMCKPDTAEYSYVIRSDGKCDALVNHIFKKYRWWCLGFGVLLLFLVCFGCVGICQCLMSGPVSKSGGPRLYDSDSEDDHPLPKHLQGKRLGMY